MADQFVPPAAPTDLGVDPGWKPRKKTSDKDTFAAPPPLTADESAALPGPPPDGFIPPPPLNEESGDNASSGSEPWYQRFGGNWWDQVNPVKQAQGVSDAVIGGVGDISQGKVPTAITNYLGQNKDLANKMWSSYGKGNYGEAARHAIGLGLNAMPGLGSTIDEAGDMAGQGDYAGALGKTAGAATNLYAGMKAPQIAEGISNAPSKVAAGMRKMVKNVNTPVVEKALQSVTPDVPMTVGQRTGSKPIQRVEQGLENYPGASGIVQDFYKGQQEALAKKGADITQQVSPIGTNDYGAGQALNQRFTQHITRLKGQADNLYQQIRQAASQNQQQVQVGTNTSPLVGPGGQPISTPVMKTFETPVDLAPVRASLQPIYDDLNRLMPDAQKAANPAFKTLDSLMKSPDTHMHAMDFDQFLSAVKSISRDGTSPYLTNRSQGVARQMIASGEQQLQQALATAGPQVPAQLQSARNLVKGYYDAADLQQTINNVQQEPGALFNNLTRGGDRVVNTLRSIQKIAPNEVKVVGRTFLQDLMNKATAEGGFARAPGIMAGWNTLGPETKAIMFGPQADAINDFMIAAKRLTQDMNPSGTNKMQAAMKQFGPSGVVLGAIVSGHPLAAITSMGGARLAAELLFTQPQALTAAISNVGAATARGIAGAGMAGGNYADAYEEQRAVAFAQKYGISMDEARKAIKDIGPQMPDIPVPEALKSKWLQQ